jgi:hypothetical protein
LRGELALASDNDIIVFAVALTGTITLNSGQLEVSKSIMINGPGANLLTVDVDANQASRVFLIDAGTTVTISGLTITNGNTFGGNGGGIYNDHATLTVTNSTLSGNSVDLSGGGIFNEGASGSATLTINNSTLSGNSANFGGGILNDGFLHGNAMLTVTNSTLSGNSAPSGGGGIFNQGLVGRATLTIGSTILASAAGANIFNSGFLGTATVTSMGYDLSSDDASAFLNQTTDQNSTDPKLGPLVDNGGPTFTHALCTASGVPDASCTGASPAIDQGKNFSGSTTDQRGFFRTFDNFAIPNATGGDGTDIGAYEVQATVCPEPQGFWKNNPAAWPVNTLTLGSQTYNQTELLVILQTPTKGDASLILADQLIAAELNIANANGTPVASTTADADAVLSLYSGKLPYMVRPNSTNGQRMVNDASVLDNFNNGLLTSGCGL